MKQFLDSVSISEDQDGTLFATLSGKSICRANITYTSDSIELNWIETDENFQRRGFGTTRLVLSNEDLSWTPTSRVHARFF